MEQSREWSSALPYTIPSESPCLPSLIRFLLKYTAFAQYMLDRFMSITTWPTFVIFASYLFLLWHSLSLWRCFVLLLEEIKFLSQGCSFLSMFKSSCIRFCLFIDWNIHTVVFPIFLVILVILILMMIALFLVVVISLSLLFFYVAFNSMLSLMLASPLSPSFLDI